MASGMSNYLKNLFLNHLLNGATMDLPETLYVQLYTTAPTAAGAGTQVNTGSFARAAISVSEDSFPEVTTGEGANAETVTFAQATAPWGTVVGYGIFDALNAGNLLWFGAVSPAKTIGTGDTLSIPVNALKFKISDMV